MKRNVLKNIISLYGLTIAKLLLPLATIPYLTRVLSVDTYGVVSYVKSVMTYVQLIVDFGFILSGTKDIVAVGTDKEKIGEETGNVFLAQLLLSLVAFCFLLFMLFSLPILQGYRLFTLLYFVPPFCTIFLFTYLFRGMEKMHILTVRYVVTKLISTTLTFVLVHGDRDLIWMPVIDIAGSLAAVALVIVEVKKMGIRIRISSLHIAIKKLKESAIYFLSSAATTAFSALNTLLIGIFMEEADVAYWSLCMSLIGAAQSLYSPILDGIYPDMVRTKELAQIKHFLKVFMPIVVVGCGFTIVVAKYALLIVGGEDYVCVAYLLRLLTPILLFSFPAMLFGWPALGALGKAERVTGTTISAALFQVMGLALLGITGHFTLITIAILRCTTEFVLLSTRGYLCYKYRSEFN